MYSALVAVAMMLAMSFCMVAEVDTSKPFVYAWREVMWTIDPAAMVTAMAEGLNGTAYEGLLEYGVGSMLYEPRLAKSFEVSEDGLIYTFYLQEDVTFHDGTAFNAEAVKFSYERVKEFELAAASYITGFDHAEVVDDYTVRLVLSFPNASFIYGIPWIKIISPTAAKEHEVDGDWGNSWYHENIVGTGPYQFDYWEPSLELVLDKFPGYWRGWEGEHLERLVFRTIREPATQRMLIEAGEVDMIDQVLIADLEILKENPDLLVVESPEVGIGQIMMNTRGKPGSVLNDRRVRQAMAYAFDYEMMINSVMEGHAGRAHGPLDPVFGEHDETIFLYNKDLDRARELLADAGYPNGGFTLRLGIVAGLQLEVDAGLMFQSGLAKLGIQLEIQQIPWPSLLTGCRDCENGPDMCFLFSGGRVPDPNNSLARPWHTNGTYDWSCLPNEELDAVLDEALRTVNPSDRTELYKTAQRMIADAIPAIWVMTNTQIKATRSWVKGYVQNPADGYVTPFYEMYFED